MTRACSWALIGTAAAAAASLWLFIQTSQWDSKSGQSSQGPELFIEQPRWKLFDGQGRVSRWLNARRLEQWAGEEAARLIQPQLRIQDRQERQWRIEASYGRIYPDGKPFLLEQDVVLQQEPGNNGLTLKTERLSIAGSGASLETDAAVVLQRGSWHFTSNGMRANLDQQQLELFTRVRGRHE